MDIKKTGELIRQLREAKHVSQYEMAEILFIDRTTITKWENGNSLPSVEMLVSLSNYFHITINELLFGEIKNDKNKRKIDRITLDLLLEKNRLVKIIILLFMFIALLFLFYFFVTTHNSVKIYKIETNSINCNLVDSYLIKTRDKIYMNLNTNFIDNKLIKYIKIFYKNGSNKEDIISTSNVQNIMLVDYLGYEEYFNFKKLDAMLDAMYIKIEYDDHSEELKLDFEKDYSNSNFFLNLDARVYTKKNSQKSTNIVNNSNLDFKNLICKTEDCALTITHNKEKYDIFYSSNLNEIILYSKIDNKFIQYKYNYDYNYFHVIREDEQQKREEYKIDLNSEKCTLGDCYLFKEDYLLFNEVLSNLSKKKSQKK